MKEKTKARLIAYYLPQFHPIPENELHWGKGFTEWTNVAKAKPLFKGHYQPHLPTELGYYDLRVPEVRKQQAELAKEHGIEGFCYWHYWFAGKRVLELPFNEVLKSGEPDFPFCLCWANHPWSATWIGEKTIIFDQTYPGKEDYIAHFYELLPAFRDKRYIKVDGALLFNLFGPKSLPDCREFTDTWRELAVKEGLPGFHFVGMGISEDQMKQFGMDSITEHSPHSLISRFPVKFMDKITYKIWGKNFTEMKAKFTKRPQVYQYAQVLKRMLTITFSANEYPIIFPNWDHSARSGKRALVIQNSTPALFSKILRYCIDAVMHRKFQKRIIFIKAWNEWAEGNYLEPERKFGRGYLEEIQKVNSSEND